MEPWKITICQNTECLYEALDANGNIKVGFHLHPNVDNEVMTQFTCPKCGLSQTWGITRREAQRVIYKRLSNA